jgi:hypothetical protein
MAASTELQEGDQVRVVRLHEGAPDHHLVGKTGELTTIHPDAPDGDFYGVRLDSGPSAGATLYFWRDELERVTTQE